MIDDIRQWKHVFKLDPDKPISDDDLERICLSGTDAVLVGGSSGVTFDNTVDLLARVRRYEVPCVLEISTDDALVPGFDAYFVPVVLNTADAKWVTGSHQRAIRDYGAAFDWSRVYAEGYLMLNPASTAALVTSATPLDDQKDAVAYARLADKLFRFPIVYMEYSGKFGDMSWVGGVARALGQARLFYGGGIDGPEKAALALDAGAHTVVVGNIIYSNLRSALETVHAVKR